MCACVHVGKDGREGGRERERERGRICSVPGLAQASQQLHWTLQVTNTGMPHPPTLSQPAANSPCHPPSMAAGNAQAQRLQRCWWQAHLIMRPLKEVYGLKPTGKGLQLLGALCAEPVPGKAHGGCTGCQVGDAGVEHEQVLPLHYEPA